MVGGILGLTTVHITWRVRALVTKFCAVIVSKLPFAVLPSAPGVSAVRFLVETPSTSCHEYLSVGPPSAVHTNVKVSFTNPVEE